MFGMDETDLTRSELLAKLNDGEPVELLRDGFPSVSATIAPTYRSTAGPVYVFDFVERVVALELPEHMVASASGVPA